MKKRRRNVKKKFNYLLGSAVGLTLTLFIVTLFIYFFDFIREFKGIILLITGVLLALFILFGVLQPKKVKKALWGKLC